VPGHDATLEDWLSFRGLPAGSSLLTLIEHERDNAALGGALVAIRNGAPVRRSLTIGKRYFGNVRQLPSGRWQARYDVAGGTKTAPSTFATRAEAQAWLDQVAEQRTPTHPVCPTCTCKPADDAG
jgi:hypothetical protein